MLQCKTPFVLVYRWMTQIEIYMQAIIGVQVTELHDMATVLHEEQVMKVLGEVEVLETHVVEEDNLKEVMLPQDQAFYMVLDPHQYPHQDTHLIQEDHKALEVAEHLHQAFQEEELHPHQIQKDHRAVEVEVVDHHQAPQYRPQRRSPRPTWWTGK